MRVRRSPLAWVFAAAIALLLQPSAARSAVFISELCDPNLNYVSDRFIEIYNAGPDTVSLTNWALTAVGNNVDVFTWTLSGDILPGQALVAGSSSTVAVFTVNFPSSGWPLNDATWNGKVGDGAKLIDSGGAVIDRVVVTGVAPSTFENQDYVRNPNIYDPNPTYTQSEWTGTPRQLATDASPGTHTVLPRPPGPIIAQVATDPAFPLPGTATDVQADVTDTSSTVSVVTLNWGTTPGALTNPIAMSLVAGSTYRTSAPIPAQPAGGAIYYKVQAGDAAFGVSTTDLKSYALYYTLTIAQIQGGAASSPYNGSSVITSGVVTARFGTYFAVQDGSGPWNGMWVRGTATPAVGDAVTVRGAVTEADAQGYAGNTLLVNGVLMSDTPGGTLPAASVVASASALSEAYEGVLVRIAGGVCTNATVGPGQWLVNDGSGAALVDGQGVAFPAILGTTYDVTGPVTYYGGSFKLEPRTSADVVFVADLVAPGITAIGEMSDSTFLVQFTEPVEPASAGTPGDYAIGGLTGTAATPDGSNPSHVLVTIPNVPAGPRVLQATGVQDLHGNATAAAGCAFTYVDTRIPAGYYDSVAGLTGPALRLALHNIIRNHAAQSYDYALTAFQVTDVRPDGKVWDMYSDVPDGTPPYEYTFGQTGGGTFEGSGYNREHSWPQSWFASASPMYSDLWIVYPTDTKVNGYRGDYAYGEVGTASITSSNGSKVGASSDPEYTGTVFEPIDAYKGDLARSTFYVSTRYETEDAGWPGGAAATGADLLPWAAHLYTTWSLNDPVSQKERLRNGAIYSIQGNRNPFVDHPEWVAQIFDPSQVNAVEGSAQVAFALRQNAPNPFRQSTTISFELPQREPVSLRIYDVAGRLARTISSGEPMEAGRHAAVWDGRNDAGARVAEGLYFYRIDAGPYRQTRRLVILH